MVISALNTMDDSLQRRCVLELFGSFDKDYRKHLEEQINGEYEIVWRGYLPHKDIPEEVGACDCAVSPLPPLEGFEVSSPAKIYEYLALGLPVVATNITPHRRILNNGNDSILINHDDPTAMGKAITHLAIDERFRRSLSRAAREESLKHNWGTRFKTIIYAINDHREFALVDTLD
jgi:glycosyltransferase involved in cell wall biosynthesis